VINARYFDGKTSRLHQVQLHVENGTAYVTGDVSREIPIDQLRVSEKSRYAARLVTFPDGAYLECHDHAEFNELLRATGFQDSAVVRLQQSWRGVIGAALAIILALILSYLYLLPLFAKVLANNMPASAEMAISSGALEFLDKNFFTPSKLPLERQRRIQTRFSQLTAVEGSELPITLVFRSSKIGANAFALPSRQIVLTDDIVTVLNDDELMAVLGHELGHIMEHHFMRRLIQTSVVAVGTSLLFGDVSSVVAAAPTLLLDLKYSRDAERDADDYAIGFLRKNGMATENLARVFEKLEKQHKGSNPVPYLSTHPLTEERLEHIRKVEVSTDTH